MCLKRTSTVSRSSNLSKTSTGLAFPSKMTTALAWECDRSRPIAQLQEMEGKFIRTYRTLKIVWGALTWALERLHALFHWSQIGKWANYQFRLKNGDKILAVNDTNCQHSSYRDVTDILKSSRGTIKLIVLHSSSRRDSSSTISSKHSRDVQPGAETEIEIIKGEKRQYLNMPFWPWNQRREKRH